MSHLKALKQEFRTVKHSEIRKSTEFMKYLRINNLEALASQTEGKN
jgi:hypothetical protein